MTSALAFSGVVKRFGRREALCGLDFRCPRGAIVGLVGPNGAGKTTAFSLAGGFLRADAGRVEILGQDGFDPWRLKGRLGLLPQDAELPERHPVRTLLVHLARLQAVASPGKAADRAIEAVHLVDRANEAVGRLSHGMRRRVAVASALLGEPELILLDEPMSGLDPGQAQSLREVLARGRGRATLVVSSHDLHEVERLCDHVVMISRGRCVREGSLAEVTGRTEVAEWELSRPLPHELLARVLGGALVSARDRRVVLRAADEAGLDSAGLALMALLAEERVAVREVRRGAGLEQKFMEATR